MGKRNSHENRPRPVSVTTVQGQIWNYPVPPPEILAQFSPEIQKEFLEQFRLEAIHRRKTDAEIMSLHHRDSWAKFWTSLGDNGFRYAALLVSFLLIAGIAGLAAYLILNGKNAEAFFAGAAGLIGFWVLKHK